MATLIAGGFVVAVAASSPPSRTRDDGVDRARADDGTMRATQYYAARKRTWGVVTAALRRSDADALETVLDTISAILCSGDLIGGNVNCFAEITDWRLVAVRGGHRVILSFALHEA